VAADVHHRSGGEGLGAVRHLQRHHAGPAPPAQRPAFPLAADITALLRDPRYSKRFDVKYGEGDGGEILGTGATVARSEP
jgi:hypothetical protein